MLAPMDALGWTNFYPLPKLAYTKLLRSFYYNLKVRNLNNLEYTIDSRVRGKDIIPNPKILSEIIGIPNEGKCIFISKTNHLDKFVSKKHMYEVISGEGKTMLTDVKHIRLEFRLFHRYIAHNIIPKAGHYNQVTNIDAFIIYKTAMEEPLNLNYVILKEMANMRNHNTRSLPFGALLTRNFLHFHITLDDQPSQNLVKGFSMDIVKKGKNLGMSKEERGKNRGNEGTHNMDIDLAIVPFKEVQGDPNIQEQEQYEASDEEHVDEDIHEGMNLN
ncbi:hypothetical protein Acr_01g0004580 [Actinidia rufa]|uniref:Putative plant transposon protein domain-containing protein n=1 Tax=Actinidia rufa TaxID=165716 RepID=A0A7J0E3Z5_9ERIC|nr:hypothetical protein Acr_01g0004580 [Actinidia rufa]